MAAVIAMLTDFSIADPYVGIMKGVMLGIAPQARFIDLSHAVHAGDVLQGALQLRQAYPYFPDGTIFVAVVDPGVGGDRRALAAQTGRHRFVGPDNGLLSLVLASEPDVRVVELADPQYRLSTVSHTFHGRDIFAPAAGHLANGVALDRFGPPVRDWQRIILPEPDVHERQIVGRVLEIDHFGNLTTNITRSQLPDAPAVTIKVAGYELHGVCTTYVDVPPGRLLALIGSQDRLEIACRNGSAQDKLGVGRGQSVIVSW